MFSRFVLWFLRKFICARPHDFLVDKNYMERWWVIPKNQYFNVYLHRFIGSDADVPHDHPWWSLSWILKGEYREHTPDGVFLRETGSFTCRPATGLHWIEVNQPVWTLFITGPKSRTWGFQCRERWIPWNEYVEMRGPDRLVNGCGEFDT